MTTRPEPGQIPADDGLRAVIGERRQLVNLAYRFLGSLAEAAEAGMEGFARVPWREIREQGELELAAQALTVRCLQRGDGGLAAAGETDDALVAVVGRSY
jgi:hypothetical protein